MAGLVVGWVGEDEGVVGGGMMRMGLVDDEGGWGWSVVMMMG